MAGTLPGYLQDYPGRTSRPSSPARQPLTVDIWLDSLGLLEYLTVLGQYRYVQDLLSLTEADLRDRCGIKNGAHRARLVSSLVMIRETMQRQRTKARTPNHFDTISSSLPSLHGGFSSPGGGSPHSGGSEYNVPRTSVYQPSSVTASYSPTMNYYASPKSLPVEDIASNVWYHGSISRVNAEDVVKNNGDFLVRDSSTQHGDYVLTVRWNGVPLHFVVNRRLTQGVVVGAVRSVYHFEENDFDTVTELIQFYIKNRKPVTEVSGAVISVGVPSPRAVQEAQRAPTTLAKYGSQPLLNSAFDSNSDDSPQTMERRLSVPSITKLSAVDIAIEDRQQIECTNGVDKVASSELQVSPVSVVSSSPAGFMKFTSDTARTGSDSDLSRPPPPKPSRMPTIKVRKSQTDKRPFVPIRNQALYDDDGKDYSDYDQVKSSPEDRSRVSGADASIEIPQSPVSENICLVSRYDCDEVINHESQFLTPDNRPLESSAMTLMKSMVFDTPPAVLARHITLIDLELLQVAVSTDLGYGVSSGLELITLPQGRYLRHDVIERFHCLRLFISVLVLKCSSPVERCRMINVWIQTAMQLQSVAFGNLYAFSAIMHALLSAPISRLTSLWLLLRQQYGASSVAFENRLCSLHRALDAASVSAPVQRPTVPYVLPLAELLEGAVLGGPLAQWSDIDTVLSHLNMARIVTAECKVYRSNASAILSTATNDGIDSALIDMLGTPTHMRLLWGSRGIGVDRAERLAKFEQVVTALSDKIEPRESSL